MLRTSRGEGRSRFAHTPAQNEERIHSPALNKNASTYTPCLNVLRWYISYLSYGRRRVNRKNGRGKAYSGSRGNLIVRNGDLSWHRRHYDEHKLREGNKDHGREAERTLRFSHFTGFLIYFLTVPNDHNFLYREFLSHKILNLSKDFLYWKKFVDYTFARIVCVLLTFTMPVEIQFQVPYSQYSEVSWKAVDAVSSNLKRIKYYLHCIEFFIYNFKIVHCLLVNVFCKFLVLFSKMW